MPQGKDSEHADEFGPGDIGAVAKLKETHAGDVLAAKDMECPLRLPADAAAGDGVRDRGEGEGRRGEDGPGDPAPPGGGPDDRLPPRLARPASRSWPGITQVHVEVIVDRMKERFGAEVELHSPHVPYREAIKGSAKAHARYKKQTGGRGQFADCHIEIEPAPGRRPGSSS